MTSCATMCDMAETRSRSIRIADDVWEAIQALPGKTDDALRAILVERKPVVDTHSEINRWFRETWGRLEALPEEVGDVLRVVVAELKGQKVGAAQVVTTPSRFEDPARIPGVSAGLAAKDPTIKKFPCKHHEDRGLSVAREGDICAACRAAGHYNDMRDCPRCTTDYGTGAL